MTGNVTLHNAIVWDSQIPENDMHASFSLTQLLVKDIPKCYNRMPNHSLNESASNQHCLPSRRCTTQFFSDCLQIFSDNFPNKRIISRGFPQNWPAHSPIVSPMDNYFWSVVKYRVFFNFGPKNLKELRQKIINVIAKTDLVEWR